MICNMLVPSICCWCKRVVNTYFFTSWSILSSAKKKTKNSTNAETEEILAGPEFDDK